MEPERTRSVAEFCASKSGGSWYIMLPAGSLVGPYFDRTIALRALSGYVLDAKRSGCRIRVMVEDSSGIRRLCALLNGGEGDCQGCDGAEPSQRCPMREDLGR